MAAPKVNVLRQKKPKRPLARPAAGFNLRNINCNIPNSVVPPGERIELDAIVAQYEGAPAGIEKIHALEQYTKQIIRKTATNERWLTRIAADLCNELSAEVNKYTNEHADQRKEVMEEAAAVINQLFRSTVSDYHTETPLLGRTRECYRVACLLLQIYVRIGAQPLAEGILKAIQQYQKFIPPLDTAKWQTQVQFAYYKSLICFRDHKFKEAADLLSLSLKAATTDDGNAIRLNRQQLTQIMRIYIPAQYIAYNKAPSQVLLKLVPALSEPYSNIITACRRGDYGQFESEAVKYTAFLKKRKVYLAFKCCLVPKVRLNLLRRVWLLLGKPKRLELSEYAKALKAAKVPTCDMDAAEFYCAQFIADGEVRGYIHHEKKLLLLSSTQPFPTLVKAVPRVSK